MKPTQFIVHRAWFDFLVLASTWFILWEVLFSWNLGFDADPLALRITSLFLTVGIVCAMCMYAHKIYDVFPFFIG